jgi:hypothetical protein
MIFHTCARGLLVGAIGFMALMGGAGVANADPDPVLPPVPGIIDQLLTQTPALFVDPSNEGEGNQGNNWGGAGMYCQNPWVHCR